MIEKTLQLSKPQAGIKAYMATIPTAANYVARLTVTYVLSYIPPEDSFPSLFLGPLSRFVFCLFLLSLKKGGREGKARQGREAGGEK